MKVRFRKKPNKPNKNEVYLRDVWYLYIDGKRDENYIIEKYLGSYLALGPTVNTSNYAKHPTLADAKRAILEKRHDMTHINVTITIGSDIEICIKP
jgi:hypothetical protein